MHYLVTGTAGFIGFHLARRLISSGHTVTGFDAVTDYYDQPLKRRRLAMLGISDAFTMVEARLEDYPALAAAAEANPPEVIFHLAAQAGVRHSFDHPRDYLDANLLGTLNVLELARALQPRHLINGSTSSVYGASDRPAFSETDPTDRPVSLYAATKKGAEVMAHSYAHLFSIPVTTVRFFTVYGPWGRPDMAYYRFTGAIDRGQPIEIYGDGSQQRDFTYVDDLVWALCGLAARVPEIGKPVAAQGATDTLSPVAPHRTVNIAAGRPVSLND
ncbi:MAG TPA: NAD-dependent epimerase/dehydratase family protein, partial [Devosiaceae bacterium]|nr:NAD-dependent epimerase/dehydratase family protein [Devosiaceae bacterium]